MKKIWCWIVMGVLFLSSTLLAYGDFNPRIITLNSQYQLGTAYYTDFGGNGFLTNSCQNPSQSWGGTSYIRLGDFNGNGRLDIASPHGASVLIKTTDPVSPNNFISYCLQHLSPMAVTNEWGTAPYTFVGDFNGDRKDDLASAAGGSVYMKLSNAGSGTFNGFQSRTWFVPNLQGPVQPWTGQLWGSSDYTFIGDFDGDNKDDIASAVGNSVRMHLSRGSAFESHLWNVTNPWATPGWNRVGDFNGDDKDDIASLVGGTVYMKRSTGSGFISESWPVVDEWGSAGYTWVADFDRDGLADIASADGGIVRMKISEGTQFRSADWPIANEWGDDWGGPQYTWLMDYDSDGYKDIVTAYNSWTLVTKRNEAAAGTGFSSATWNYFGWWGVPENTWALDHSRFSFLASP